LIIDIFNHCYPKKFLKEYVKTKYSKIAWMKVEPSIRERADFWDPETRVKIMDKFGIGIQVLSLAMTPYQLPSEPFELTKIANDRIVEEFVYKYPERFLGVATLASLTGEALDELDRCIRDLGLKGVQIFTCMNGKPLDRAEFLPFYEKMAKYDLPIFIHPTSVGINEDVNPWPKVYGISLNWPYYSSMAMGMLVYGGILMKYPNLKVVIHHLGGMIPFYAERIHAFYDVHPEFQEQPRGLGIKQLLDKHPLEYFKMFYADTAVNGSMIAMRCGYSFFGTEHVVFATDYPYTLVGPPTYVDLENTMKSVKDLDIPQEHKQMIFEDNARRILKME